MIINSANLDKIRVGFKSLFQEQLEATETMYREIATVVPSTAAEEKYGWLGKTPNVREWFGDRVVQNLMEHDYAIKNKDYELTIGVDRNFIEDDTLGVYTPIFRQFGESVAAWPDQLVWSLLAAGFDTLCYDGQNFFDTDHPVLDANGAPQSVSNTQGGVGTAWFLLDLSKVLKPIIWQERKKGQFVALDRPDDPNVFSKKEFQYGWDGRGNAGFGFWQFAFGSKQTLDKDNYKAAREAMQSFKGDYGRPLNVKATHLVFPPSLEGNALEILNAERDAAGATNVYKGTAKGLNIAWLA